MNIEFENEGHRYRSDLGSGVSLARPIQFLDSQPNPWNVSVPTKTPVTTDDFTGSTSAGGACNVDQLSLIPHCHGTHTETICLLYTSPSPRDGLLSRMPSSA